jgi:predicted metalloprotease
MCFGVDPSIILHQGTEMGGGTLIQTVPVQPSAADNELADLVSVVHANTEDTWKSFSDGVEDIKVKKGHLKKKLKEQYRFSIAETRKRP